MTRTTLRASLFVGCTLVALALGARTGQAHKAVTSKYNYNDDVFPIVEKRCASCHVKDGVAPMSLVTYDEAMPWAESIRVELIAGHMPPWNAEPGFGDLSPAHVLTSKELDVLLTWSTGGTPRGALDQKLPAIGLKNEWALGAPDVALPLPAEFNLAADKMEDTQEFTIPSGLTSARWLRAADLLPGTPSIVRSAVIFLKTPGAKDADTIVGRWLPGRLADAVSKGTAFQVPAGAEIGVRIHYKKTWQFEGKPMKDRSTVGLYFAAGPQEKALESLAVESAPTDGSTPKVAFSRTLDRDVDALAVTPDQVPGNITLQVEAVKPDGSRQPMLRVNTRADWNRRYWFEKPVSLPKGTKVEVVANMVDPDIMSSAFGPSLAPKSSASATPIRITLDVTGR